MNTKLHTFKATFLSVLFSLLIVFSTVASASAATKANQQAPRDAAAYQAWLTKEVHHELVMLPWLSVFDNLEYQVEGGKVTLLGQVTRPSIKSDAEGAIKHLEGVTQVDNQIEVLPLSPNDDRIRRATYRSIYDYPALDRYAMGVLPSIRIVVKNGNITLEGVVSNETDKNVAGIRANSVPGAFSVTNNLRVEGGK
jgi:hyperosmotically inducible periplasmic protein